MIETDAPYLTPRTIRPKPKSSRNEPSYLPYIVKEIAKLTDHSEQDIIRQTTENARHVFGLGSNYMNRKLALIAAYISVVSYQSCFVFS